MRKMHTYIRMKPYKNSCITAAARWKIMDRDSTITKPEAMVAGNRHNGPPGWLTNFEETLFLTIKNGIFLLLLSSNLCIVMYNNTALGSRDRNVWQQCCTATSARYYQWYYWSWKTMLWGAMLLQSSSSISKRSLRWKQEVWDHQL